MTNISKVLRIRSRCLRVVGQEEEVVGFVVGIIVGSIRADGCNVILYAEFRIERVGDVRNCDVVELAVDDVPSQFGLYFGFVLGDLFCIVVVGPQWQAQTAEAKGRL